MERDIQSYTAGGTVNPRRFIKMGASDGVAIQATSSAATIIGISEQVVGPSTNNVAASGGTFDVIKGDQALLELGDTVTRGQYLTADANGKGIPAVIVAGTPLYVGAYAEESGVAGDYILVTLMPCVIANDTGIVTANITISSAELLALNATPKQLVAAPGAGKALILVDAQLDLAYATTAYAGIAAGEDLEIRYTNGSGQLVATVETTGFLDATAAAYRHIYPASAAAIAPAENAALVMDLAAGEITTGDSPLKVRVRYREITLAL